MTLAMLVKSHQSQAFRPKHGVKSMNKAPAVPKARTEHSPNALTQPLTC
jgi:hypothetical protein